MVNSVAVAELGMDPVCSLDDLEIVFKGNDAVYAVDEDGQITFEKEIYGGESYFSYYYCDRCGQDWSETAVQNQDKCWELAKAHLAES